MDRRSKLKDEIKKSHLLYLCDIDIIIAGLKYCKHRLNAAKTAQNKYGDYAHKGLCTYLCLGLEMNKVEIGYYPVRKFIWIFGDYYNISDEQVHFFNCYDLYGLNKRLKMCDFIIELLEEIKHEREL